MRHRNIAYQQRLFDSAATVERLEVDELTLSILGFTHIESSLETTETELAKLIRELHATDCTHTWKKFDPHAADSLQHQIHHFENLRRPTNIYFYHGLQPNGQRSLVGIGAVAEKISWNFMFDGFPVIARCYIMNEYRNHRLYAPILRHRFDQCLKIFGDRLRGIHMGSSNPRVFAAIKHGVFVRSLVYLGDEYLDVKNGQDIVRDFMWFTDAFKFELRNVCDNARPDPKTRQLSLMIEQLLDNKFDGSTYKKLVTLLKKIQSGENEWSPLSNLAFRQLMAFASSIPIIEKDTCGEPTDLAWSRRIA